VDDAEFQQVIVSPQERQAHYRTMVPAYFDRVTDTYREKWSDSFHFALFAGNEKLEDALLATEQRIADEGRFGPGQRVLDIGCGVGGPALNIAAYSKSHITGISITPRQIVVARQRASQRGLDDLTHFEVADAMSLPFAGGSFDAAYVFDAGCHMPDKAAFCRETARILRPGGCFLGLDWFKKDGLSQDEEERYIEPICRLHSVPHLSGLTHFRGHLLGAGLDVQLLEDVAQKGNILRNWELVDTLAVRGIRGLLPWLIPPTLRMLTDGGLALAKAARAGAFVIGHWIAHKPLTPRAVT
jgi:ubiquinone/menaquinone biosynthesis C-methylase UbiE